jgi:hypothetical protein
MKKKFTFFCLLLSLFYLGCDVPQQAVSCYTGKIRITNNSKNSYKLYIDKALKAKVNGNTYLEFDLPEGSHIFKAEQEHGYVLYPTVKSATIAIYGCKFSEWAFP